MKYTFERRLLRIEMLLDSAWQKENPEHVKACIKEALAHIRVIRRQYRKMMKGWQFTLTQLEHHPYHKKKPWSMSKISGLVRPIDSEA